MSRRVFDRDCKLAAVRLIVEDEMDVNEVSRSTASLPSTVTGSRHTTTRRRSGGWRRRTGNF